MKHVTWETRRKWKLWAITIVAGLAVAPVAQSVIGRTERIEHRHTSPDENVKKLEDKLGIVGQVLELPVIRSFAITHLAITIACLGFLTGAAASLTRRNWIHDRFLASFNDDILLAVTDLDRPDRDGDEGRGFVRLPWILGEVGPRRKAFFQINDWCLGCVGKALPRLSRDRLSLAVLVGQAGSGKSRMGYEVARQLCRQDRLGNEARRLWVSWRLGVYLRHVTFGLQRREDDPWDAGLIVRGAKDPDFQSYCARLSKWRPRRPTLLLLDDPLPSFSQKVWTALVDANSAKGFNYAVCLLVMNQTVPIDSGLEYSPSSCSWIFENNPADPSPISLPSDAWFTREETVTVAFRSGYLQGIPVESQRVARAQLYDVTGGNPLLVQLAIEWLCDEHNLADITAEVLSERRAQRILAALRDRGVSEDSQLVALALSTLVNGGIRDEIYKIIGLVTPHPVPLPSIRVLKACFPTEPLSPDSTMRLPPVRPALIGDAFVDCVLVQIGSDRADALAVAAFRLDPATMLRSIRRARSTKSPMANALATIDPMKIPGLDPIELTLALADVAAICQLDDRPLSTAESRNRNHAYALQAIDRLGPKQRGAFCKSFVENCIIRMEQRGWRQPRHSLVLQLMDYAANHEQVVVSPESWILLFKIMRHQATYACSGMIRAALSVESDLLADEFATAAWLAFQDDQCNRSSPIFEALASGCYKRGASGPGMVFEAMALVSDPTSARKVANRAAKVVLSDSAVDKNRQVAAAARCYEAFAWSHVPNGAQAVATRVAALEVSILASQSPDDIQIQRKAAVAGYYEAFAWSQVPWGSQAAEARKAATDVAERAAQFRNDIEIQRSAANAKRFEAWAWSRVPGGAAAAEARAAATDVAERAAHFPDDLEIQLQAVVARRYETNAWSAVGEGAQAAATAAAEVALYGSRFPNDILIQRQVAAARSLEAWAWSQGLAGSMATSARAAAARSGAAAVANCAACFADDDQIQLEAANARTSEARAWSLMLTGGADAAREAAADVADRASRFADNIKFQREVVQARCYEARAWSHAPAGGSAAEAKAAATETADRANRYPEDIEIQRDAAAARRYEARAWSRVPVGAGAEAAHAAAAEVAKRAIRFPADIEIQREAATAKRHEAFAWRGVPEGRKAETARAVAAEVVNIAARSPNDTEIQREATIARHYEALAWNDIPAGAGAVAAQEAAADVIKRSARFPDDIQIQQVASTWR